MDVRIVNAAPVSFCQSVIRGKVILDRDPGRRADFENMAGFRIRLVHLCWEVDDRQVHDLVRGRIGDFKRFLDAVGGFLGWKDLPTHL